MALVSFASCSPFRGLRGGLLLGDPTPVRNVSWCRQKARAADLGLAYSPATESWPTVGGTEHGSLAVLAHGYPADARSLRCPFAPGHGAGRYRHDAGLAVGPSSADVDVENDFLRLLDRKGRSFDVVGKVRFEEGEVLASRSRWSRVGNIRQWRRIQN